MQLHFYKMPIRFSVLVMLLLMFMCTEVVTSSKSRHRGRSVWRPFSLYGRKLTAQGRSASSSLPYNAPTPSPSVNQARGFMKMWKGMFNQPDTNIIIITQPAPTTTATTTDQTTPADTEARDDSGTTTAIADSDGRDDSSNALPSLDNDLLNSDIFNLDDDNSSDVVQPYGRTRNHSLKRKPKPKPKPKRQQHRYRNHRPHTENRRRAEQIANRLAKKPQSTANIFSLSGNAGGGGSSSSNVGGSSSNNAFDVFAGSLSLNTNARIQSIMNALRQQTPIVYN